MPLLSPKTRYEHRIKWSILNFHTCPSWHDLVIASPEFNIRWLDVVTLRFSLQAQGPGNGMCFAVHCVGNIDCYRAHRPSLNVQVVIPIEEIRTANNIVPPLRPRTQPLVPNAVVCFGLDGVYPGMPLKEGKLVFHVTLRTMVDQGQFWATMMNPHMMALSNELVSMVTRPAYSNMFIESEQSVKFDTHTCMLRARMPVIYQNEDFSMSDTGSSSDDSGRPVDEDIRVFGTDMPTETTRTLIFYLYGRIASSIPENQRVKLLNFAQRYELKDLENMLTLHPSEYLLGTSMVQEEMDFNIPVSDLRENLKIPKMWFPNARNIITAVSYTVFSDRHMEFSFDLESHPQDPVNMKLTVMLKNASGQVLKEHLFWHTFTDKKTWSSPRFVALGLEDVQMISYQVQMIGGRFDHKEAVENTRERAPTETPLLGFNNTLAFSEQLLGLYTSQKGCDFELHIGSETLNVHKAIVVARSPMIFRMVKAKEKKPNDRSVVMLKLRDNLQVRLVEEIVIYMYCGRITPKTTEHMDDLADVADYFDMPFLVEYLIFLTK